MPYRHSHIPVELFSFLVDQHYLTEKKKKKQRNTPSKMIPPSTPSSSKGVFHGSTQLELAGVCTTKASSLEPKRTYLSNQTYVHFENKKIGSLFILFTFLSVCKCK